MGEVDQIGGVASAGDDGGFGGEAEGGEDAGEAWRVCDDGEDSEAAVAARALEDVHLEGAAEQARPVEARCRRVEQALVEAIPVASREDVGGEALDS